MKKIITVAGKEVEMVTSGATPIFYRNEFGNDFYESFRSIVKLATSAENAETDEERFDLFFSPEDIELIQKFAWVYAKNATPDIEPLGKWLAQFEEFPVMDVLVELVELMMKSITSKKI